MKHFFFVLVSSLFIFASCASKSTKPEIQSGPTSKEVMYQVGADNFKGYIATPAIKNPEVIKNKKQKKETSLEDSGAILSTQKVPAVIIVHEWWGHNEFTREKADELATLGYVAMAIDMYGDGKTADHPSQAGEFAKQAMSNFSLAKQRFDKALEVLKSQPNVDPTKIAAIGFCFGGTVVLNMAMSGEPDLDLVASFHGGLSKDMKIKTNTMPKVLIFNGAADPMVKKDQVDYVKSILSKAKVSYVFESYANAKHAFTNKKADELGEKFKLPIAYDKDAAEKSWSTFLEELKKI